MEVFAEEEGLSSSAIDAGGRLKIQKSPIFCAETTSAHPLLGGVTRGLHQFHFFDSAARFSDQCTSCARFEQRSRIAGAHAWSAGSGVCLLQRTPVTGLRVVDVKSLGQRLSVYVVAYRHQQFLIGGSPNGLLLLSPLDADPSVSGSSSSSDPGPPAANLSAKLSANLSVNPASEGSFQSVLEKASTPSV